MGGIDETAVNALLSAARTAHVEKKRKAGVINKQGTVIASPDYATSEQHIVEALRLRCEAHALDPDHQASGWLIPIPPASRPVPEADLIRFYVAYAKPFIPADVLAQVLERFPAYADVRYIP